MNQDRAVPVGPPVPRLRDDIARLASRLLTHVPNLSRSEKQLLADVQRTDGRCTFARLEHLADIASRSPDAADRESLPATLRGRTRRHERAIAGISILAIEQEEAEAEGDLNCARVSRLVHDSAVARAREKECALRELNAASRLLEALG